MMDVLHAALALVYAAALGVMVALVAGLPLLGLLWLVGAL